MTEDETLEQSQSLHPTQPQTSEAKTQYEIKASSLPSKNIAKITKQGIFIPRSMFEQWQDVEIIAETQRIVIQPKETELTEDEHTIQILEDCGFLLSSTPLPENYVPLSEEEKEALRQALSVGKPLSQIVIEDREERW